MGKYDSYYEFEDNARALTVANIAQANELAEANRLTRLQMEKFLTFNVTNREEALPVQFTKEELEDQS